MADWMPPLPEQQRLELITFSRNDLLQVVGYTPHSMHAYGQACARAALEQAAALCDEFQRQHGDSDNHGAFLALRIRALAREVQGC